MSNQKPTASTPLDLSAQPAQSEQDLLFPSPQAPPMRSRLKERREGKAANWQRELRKKLLSNAALIGAEQKRQANSSLAEKDFAFYKSKCAGLQDQVASLEAKLQIQKHRAKELHTFNQENDAFSSRRIAELVKQVTELRKENTRLNMSNAQLMKRSKIE